MSQCLASSDYRATPPTVPTALRVIPFTDQDYTRAVYGALRTRKVCWDIDYRGKEERN